MNQPQNNPVSTSQIQASLKKLPSSSKRPRFTIAALVIAIVAIIGAYVLLANSTPDAFNWGALPIVGFIYVFVLLSFALLIIGFILKERGRFVLVVRVLIVGLVILTFSGEASYIYNKYQIHRIIDDPDTRFDPIVIHTPYEYEVMPDYLAYFFSSRDVKYQLSYDDYDKCLYTKETAGVGFVDLNKDDILEVILATCLDSKEPEMHIYQWFPDKGYQWKNIGLIFHDNLSITPQVNKLGFPYAMRVRSSGGPYCESIDNYVRTDDGAYYRPISFMLERKFTSDECARAFASKISTQLVLLSSFIKIDTKENW